MLVLCDTHQQGSQPDQAGPPHPANTRFACATVMESAASSAPVFSVEQQFTLLGHNSQWPLGARCTPELHTVRAGRLIRRKFCAVPPPACCLRSTIGYGQAADRDPALQAGLSSQQESCRPASVLWELVLSTAAPSQARCWPPVSVLVSQSQVCCRCILTATNAAPPSPALSDMQSVTRPATPCTLRSCWHSPCLPCWAGSISDTHSTGCRQDQWLRHEGLALFCRHTGRALSRPVVLPCGALPRRGAGRPSVDLPLYPATDF